MSFTIKNLLLAGLFLALFLFIGKKMRTGLSFGEVVGFELSYFKKTTETTVRKWASDKVSSGETKLVALEKNTHFDFLYIVGYVFLGIFLAKLAAGQNQAGPANIIAILLLVAGLCDVVENLQILQIIREDFGLRPMVMTVCAAAKFGLLGVSLAWAVWLGAERLLVFLKS